MAATARRIAAEDEGGWPQELAAWHKDVRLQALERLTRKQAPPPSWLRIGAFVLVLLLQGLLLRALHDAMRQPPLAQSAPVRVRLIVETAEPPLPQPPPLPMRQPPPARVVARAAPLPPAPAEAPPAAAPVLHIFNADGSVDLPRESARTDAMTATFAAPPPSSESLAVMRHQRPLKVRPNYFAQHWKQQNGSSINDFIADNLAFEKEFTLPWGTHLKCGGVYLFIAAVGGCGWYTPYRYYIPTEHWRPATSLDEE